MTHPKMTNGERLEIAIAGSFASGLLVWPLFSVLLLYYGVAFEAMLLFLAALPAGLIVGWLGADRFERWERRR